MGLFFFFFYLESLKTEVHFAIKLSKLLILSHLTSKPDTEKGEESSLSLFFKGLLRKCFTRAFLVVFFFKTQTTIFFTSQYSNIDNTAQVGNEKLPLPNPLK